MLYFTVCNCFVNYFIWENTLILSDKTEKTICQDSGNIKLSFNKKLLPKGKQSHWYEDCIILA